MYCAIAWVVGENCTTMEIIPVFRTFPIDLLWRLLQATNLSADAMAMVFFSKRFIWAHVTIANDAFIWI